jgi:hypothetical protein
MNNPQPLSPLDLVQAMQDRTNQLVKAFQEMSKLQQEKVISPGDKTCANCIAYLGEILEAEKSKKVLHPQIWGEIDKTYRHLKRREAGVAMMINRIKNKRN